jgi:hypothetical protein
LPTTAAAVCALDQCNEAQFVVGAASTVSAPEHARAPAAIDQRRPDDAIQTLLLYRMGRSTGWMAFFTLVIAIAGAAGGYFLWAQANVMQDQSDQLQDLSDKLQKSFDASRIQSDALIETMHAIAQQIGQSREAMDRLSNADRPWLGIESVSTGSLQADAKLPVIARVRNAGRTPAMDVMISLTTMTASAPTDAGAGSEVCKACPRTFVLPNATVNNDVSVESSVLTGPRVIRLKTGEETLWLIGRIDYTDPAAHPHTTRVCMVYAPKAAAFNACPEGNRID